MTCLMRGLRAQHSRVTEETSHIKQQPLCSPSSPHLSLKTLTGFQTTGGGGVVHDKGLTVSV